RGHRWWVTSVIGGVAGRWNRYRTLTRRGQRERRRRRDGGISRGRRPPRARHLRRNFDVLRIGNVHDKLGVTFLGWTQRFQQSEIFGLAERTLPRPPRIRSPIRLRFHGLVVRVEHDRAPLHETGQRHTDVRVVPHHVRPLRREPPKR